MKFQLEILLRLSNLCNMSASDRFRSPSFTAWYCNWYFRTI